MGYDGQIIVIKKKVIETAKKMFPICSFSEIYSQYLYTREYSKEYDFPTEEESISVAYFNTNVFTEYFKENTLENDEARIIDQKTYEEFKKWITYKVKNTTLFDIETGQITDSQANNYIRIYHALQKLNVDWKTECVVFQNDW